VRFTNAHETLLWAQKNKGAPYTFNHHSMKALNADLQMRSDWEIPLCTGKERVKLNGAKAHSTQKPEALLYRVLLSSTNPGDLVLDPFFGLGTTGAVAKKLHRRWIGIERDPVYIQLARERIDAIQVEPFSEELFRSATPRPQRLPFGALLAAGLLHPGQTLYFGPTGDLTAVILSDGSLRHGDLTGSIHQLGRQLQNAPCNGWQVWHYLDPATGQRLPIDHLRQEYLSRAAGPALDGQTPSS
jgi:modification methylase